MGTAIEKRRYTRDEMLKILADMGLKKAYKPYQELDNDTILLETRKPATITDGYLSGSEIDVYNISTIRVWTPRLKKANALAKAFGFKIRLFDQGEAELYIPADKADTFLHSFGAKIAWTRKDTSTPEQRAKRIEALKKWREDQKQAKERAANEPNLAKT